MQTAMQTNGQANYTVLYTCRLLRVNVSKRCKRILVYSDKGRRPWAGWVIEILVNESGAIANKMVVPTLRSTPTPHWRGPLPAPQEKGGWVEREGGWESRGGRGRAGGRERAWGTAE